MSMYVILCYLDTWKSYRIQGHNKAINFMHANIVQRVTGESNIMSEQRIGYPIEMSSIATRHVNEKTLELNITHEGMIKAGVSVLGFTQKQESRVGADVLFPLGKPFFLQYKAAKSGVDRLRVRFRVNNNKKKNQHRVLDTIARSGLCDAYYVFPLIVSSTFLMKNYGNLLNLTSMVDASRLTGNLNWVNQAHSVIVWQNHSFTVRSQKKVQGEGFSAEQFFDRISSREREKVSEGIKLSDFVEDLIERLDSVVQESGIYGESEHTLAVVGTDIHRSKLGYLQLPIRIKGLQ